MCSTPSNVGTKKRIFKKEEKRRIVCGEKSKLSFL